ncbi:MAG: hypothetical protein IJ428_06720 [Clostridia bacterium]|nr:hypothetical protein [Clostridia bacterium]
MKITPIGSPETVMHNPDSRHNYFAWPTVTRLQNGKLAVVASGFRLFHVCPFGKTVISYSEDDGYPSTVELSDGSLLTVFYAHTDNDGLAVILQQKWSFEK